MKLDGDFFFFWQVRVVLKVAGYITDDVKIEQLTAFYVIVSII